MKRIRIESDYQAIEFIESLIENKRLFHFDDNPENMIWNEPISEIDLYIITLNWRDLWEFCDPWTLFDRYPTLWDKWEAACNA